MNKLLASVKNFICDEEGATAVEYGILVAAIAAAIVIITMIIGGQIENAFNRICQAIAPNTQACAPAAGA